VGWLGILGRDDPWAVVGCRPPPFVSPSSLAGLPLFFSLLADGSVPRVGLHGIWCGESRSAAAGGRACVRDTVCVCGAQRVLGKRPQRLGRDANATSRPHRGVDAHGEAVAQAWRGWARSGSKWSCRDAARRGHGLASRRWRARTRAGPSIPGPRRGRAVCGAPASRARGTPRRR
jgi:hypothetical protein